MCSQAYDVAVSNTFQVVIVLTKYKCLIALGDTHTHCKLNDLLEQHEYSSCLKNTGYSQWT